MTSTTASPFPAYTPSTIILNSFSQVYVDEANIQIAPWIMGTFADMFLQGVLAVQTTNYFTYSPGDGSRRRFTWLVLFATLLCLLKSVQNMVIVWDTVITNFANPDISQILVAVDWVHYTTSLSTAIIALFVQSFFVYRYWLLTKRLWICGLMVLGMVVSLVGASLVIVYIPRLANATVKVWSLVHFLAAVLVDTAITSLTAYHLYRQKNVVFSNTVTPSVATPSYNDGRPAVTTTQSTAQMIDRLIRMTWQSALPPTLCVIVNAVVLESLPLELTHIAFNMVLPKLYVISLMYTLNTRNEMRGERTSNNETSVHRDTRSRSRPLSNNPNFKRSYGGTELNLGTGGNQFSLGSRSGDTYRNSGQMERGVSGRGRVHRNSVGRKLDVHVETVVTRSQPGDNYLEMDDFESSTDPVKSTSVKGGDAEFEREVWDAKR